MAVRQERVHRFSTEEERVQLRTSELLSVVVDLPRERLVVVVEEADPLQLRVLVVFVVDVLEIVAATGQTVVSPVLLRVPGVVQFAVVFAHLVDVFSPDAVVLSIQHVGSEILEGDLQPNHELQKYVSLRWYFG